jgi:hypothetical protein
MPNVPTYPNDYDIKSFPTIVIPYLGIYMDTIRENIRPMPVEGNWYVDSLDIHDLLLVRKRVLMVLIHIYGVNGESIVCIHLDRLWLPPPRLLLLLLRVKVLVEEEEVVVVGVTTT